MTDTEIIKALECCWENEKNSTCQYCDQCTMADCDLNIDEDDCYGALYGRAIALINHQKAEIELWQNEYRRACAERDAHIATTRFIRAEAAKEFAEKLEKRFGEFIYGESSCSGIYNRQPCKRNGR